jgi:hypothetical protein
VPMPTLELSAALSDLFAASDLVAASDLFAVSAGEL